MPNAFDQFDAPKASNPFDTFDQQQGDALAARKTDDRPLFSLDPESFGAGKINDFMIEAGNAAANIAKTGVDLVAPGSAASRAIEGFTKSGEANQSDYIKAEKSALAANVQKAKDAGDTGIAAQFGYFAENPSMFAGQVVGNVGPFAALGRGLAAVGGTNAALQGTAIAGAASGGGSVRGSILDKIEATDDATLQAKSPEYADLRAKGATEFQAKQDIGTKFLQNLPEIAAGAGVGYLTGRLGLEQIVAGGANAGVFRTMLSEAVQEAVEEGVQQTAANSGVRKINPDQSLTEDVALNAAVGAAMGAAGGGAVSAADRVASMARSNASQEPQAAPAVAPSAAAPESAPANQEPTAAEKALAPTNITALDRAQELGAEVQRAQSRLAELNAPDSGYGPVFDQERADLQAEIAKMQGERDALTKAWPKAVTGAPASFTTEAGARIDSNYALVDADELVTSHDANLRQNPAYPQELQPRDRQRAASEQQISQIVQKLDPARLGLSADAATGAPIIGADGLVESGNARTIALKRIYQANGAKADDYRNFLRQNAAQFGVSADAIDSMAKPVLVRVRQTPVNRAEFARQANASTVAQMSPSEQARADAARMDVLDDLQPDEQGDFATSRNFIRRFLSKLPATEQAGMIDAAGGLSQAGYSRIRNAILAKAYGDSPVLLRMTDSLDDNLRNISKALVQAAPTIARTRQAIADGNLFNADVTPHLLGAVEALASLKDQGKTVQDELAQMGMFGDKYSPETRDMLQFLGENIRRPRAIADFLRAFNEALESQGHPGQGDIFGERQAPAAADLMNIAKGQANDAAATSAATAQSGGGGGSVAENEGRDQARAQDDGRQKQGEWVAFPPESGTLGIPRSQMPQIKGEHRGALINFLKGRGIDSEKSDIAADQLKPTQAEFSPKKVEGWKEVREGSDRSVLSSSDGYILDGHHQWMAALVTGEPVQQIRLDAPITSLLAAVDEFPSVKRSDGATPEQLREAAMADFKAAAADLADIIANATGARAMMVKPDTPNLIPTIVKLFEAAFKMGYMDLKAAGKWVREQLRKDPAMKKHANFLPNSALDEAAREAYAKFQREQTQQDAAQADLFAAKPEAPKGQVDMFGAASNIAKPDDGMVSEAEYARYDMKRDNYAAPAVDSFMSPEVVSETQSLIDRYKKEAPKPNLSDEDRARAEDLLKPRLDLAEQAKPEYDRKVLYLAKKHGIGQMLAPLKGLARGAEKLALEENFEVSGMKDLLRSTIIVDDRSKIGPLLREIYQRFNVMRVKNRTDVALDGFPGNLKNEGPTKAGYGDVLINVTEPNGTVAEIQINVPEMFGAKDNGHKLYEVQRAQEKGTPLYDELDKAQAAFYGDAERAYQDRATSASRKNRASSAGKEEAAGGRAAAGARAPESDSLNTLPSGNRTKASPPSDSANSQPGGNLSGNFIASTSNSSVVDSAKNGYAGDGKATAKGAKNATENASEGGAEGKGAGSVSQPDRKRATDTLRERQGGRDLFDDHVGPDAGEARAGVRQTAAPGTSATTESTGRRNPRAGADRGVGVPATREIPVKSGRNYRFTDEDLSYAGSWEKRARQNIDAVKLLKQLEAEGRQATREEQSVLAKFNGWGASEIANKIFGSTLEAKAKALQSYKDAKAVADDLKLDGFNRHQRGHWQAFEAISAMRKAAGEPAPNFYNSEFNRITLAQLEAAKPSPADIRWIEMAEELHGLLSKDEWADASRSTQYAHYTSKGVVRSMWKAIERMGYNGGAYLEPGSGVGVFPGLADPAVATNSAYTGIEFDPITGGILKQLFPDERILVESFVDSKLPKNFYDMAIGNPPFHNTPILADPEYKKHAFALHDYFFAKTLDRVKPGGLVAFVTSRYTMDKKGDKARKYMAERADLVGAIRLPQTAFQKNAGTEVVTDILFLRKKVPGETFAGAQPWEGLGEVKVGSDTHLINEYFVAHPEMVLGQHATTGSMYSKNEYTVEPNAGEDIEAAVERAAATLPADIMAAPRGSASEAAKVRELDFNPKAQKEGNYYVSDKGVLMVREGGVGQPAELKSPKDAELIKDFVGLRDALKQAHYDQLNDGDWQASLANLRKAYDAFVSKNGPINQFTEYEQRVKVEVEDEETGQISKVDDTETRRRYPVLTKIQDDPDYTLVSALEDVHPETGAITPSKFLSERVLGKSAKPEITSATDALLSVLADVGHVDIGMIADRLNLSEEAAIAELGPTIYQDPAAGWVTADEYLSGNVRKKLNDAIEAAKSDKRYERNVEALRNSQPLPIPADRINAALGQPWIDPQYYRAFLHQLAGVKSRIEFNTLTGNWSFVWVDGYHGDKAQRDWGVITGDRKTQWHAGKIFEHAMTGAPIRITKTIGEGKDKKTVLDTASTELANQKVRDMQEAFKSWIFSDAERTEKLVQKYNDTMNNIVPRKFDGSHMTLPGTSKLFHIFDHVKRGAWRIIQSGNTYLAHAVGSGKTFQMIISAMEQKRLGLIKKPMMVVPNHMLGQFAKEWLDLYPAARLMVADEKNFHMDNRRRFVSRVALSDLDGVIITHSAFKLLDLDPAFKREMIESELDLARAALEEAEENDSGTGRKSPKVKEIEAQIERMEQKLEAAMSGEGKDKNVRFDEMGVDMLYVDEAHAYRKLSYQTERQVKGISPTGSDASFDMWMKTRWLERKNPGRSLVMASGTPITNTMAELYTVQRFMAPDVLEERGIASFDAWASMFGRENTSIEADASGKYMPVTRFSKFVNIPELVQMFREFADVVTADQLAALLGDRRPRVDGGSRKIEIVEPGAAYDDYKKNELGPRLEASRKWKPSPDQPNNPDPIIKIIGDGRLAAIDMRFVDPSMENDPDSKLNKMIDGVVATYKETADWVYHDKAGKPEPQRGAAQMVFSDLGFGEGVADRRGFSARRWMEKRLKEAGVNLDHVAFMSDYKKSSEKLKLFKDMNAGRKRILVGSSKNMGTGVNAQQRLIELHHLDTPWFPADLEQREGRIIRQGNKNPLVRIKAYSTKGSYDSVMWQMLASKQAFIDQAMSGDGTVREVEDLSEASQYMIATAMTADDPRAIVLAGLKAEIEKLNRLYQAHEEQRARAKQEYEWAGQTIAANQRLLPEVEAAAKMVQDLSGDNFRAKAAGKTFEKRAEWGDEIMRQVKAKTLPGASTQKIGEISGFPVVFKVEKWGDSVIGKAVMMTSAEEGSLLFVLGDGAEGQGVAMRAQNALAAIKKAPDRNRERIAEATAKRESLVTRLDAQFPMAAMLADKVREASALEEAMTAPEATAVGAAPEGDTKLSAGGAGRGMALDAVQKVADRIAANFKNLPDVVVVASPADQSVPQALRDFIERKGATATVEGAYHGGKIYLFASGLRDEARAEFVLAEHEVTHYGLRGILGDGLDTVMRSILNNNPAIRKEAARLAKRDDRLADIAYVEEVLADMPTASLPRLNGWRRVVERVSAGLRKLGFSALSDRLDGWMRGTLSDQQKADLFVAGLVRRARDFARRPGDGQPTIGETRLAQSLEDDLQQQSAYLEERAKAAGYASVDEFAAKDFDGFMKAAEAWRDENPVEEALLSSGQQGKTVAERADDVIADKVRAWRPVDRLFEGAFKAVRFDRVTKAAYDKVGDFLARRTPEGVKAALVSDYGLPDAMQDARAMLAGRMSVQLRKTGTLIDKLNGLTREESRVAYEWLTTNDPQALAHFEKQLPADSIQALKDVKTAIDALSREAVAQGQLSEDAYKRNAMQYLHRSYLKHTVNVTKGESERRRRAISIMGDQYKARGITETAAMGKIKNAAPDWWNRKLQAGKADTQLRGEKFIRFEKRGHKGAGVAALPGMPAGGQRAPLREVEYWPASEPTPAKYADWDKAGTWEVRDTKGADVVLWRDFSKAEREAMGEIDEARFAIAKTLHGMIHDVEVGRYLEWVGKQYGIALRDKVPGEVVDAHELALNTMFHIYRPGEWVQVPTTKVAGTDVLRYGKLAGKYIPGPVWNDVRQIAAGPFQPFGETYATLLSWWKTAKTALSPAVHTNNVMANFVMADWHGVGAAHVRKALNIILSASARQGRGVIGRTGNLASRAGRVDADVAREIMNRYQDSGGNLGTWAQSELKGDQLQPLLEAIEREAGANAQQAEIGTFAALQKLLQGQFPQAWEAFKGSKPAKMVSNEAGSLLDLYQAEDDVFRLAAWLKAKEEGHSDLVAGKAARRSFLDYHINAPVIQALRQTVLPFAAFTYRAIPMLLETAAHRPWKIAKLAAVAGMLNALGYAALGMGGDDEDKERKWIPDEKSGRVWFGVPKLVRMPWNDTNGQPVFLDIRRWIPVGDVFDIGQGHSAVPIPPSLMPGGPLAIMAEVVLNRTQFTGKPISLETDTTGEKLAKTFDHLYKSFAPNVLGLPGTYATQGVMDAAKGRTDSFGREQSVTQAVATGLGVKVGSYAPDVMRSNQVRKLKAEQGEIDEQIGKLKREYQRKGMTFEEFQEKVRAQQDKKRKLNDEYQKKAAAGG